MDTVMKSLVVILVMAVVIIVLGCRYIDHSINSMIAEAHASVMAEKTSQSGLECVTAHIINDGASNNYGLDRMQPAAGL